MEKNKELEHFIRFQEAMNAGRSDYPVEKWNRRAQLWEHEQHNRRKGDERVRRAVEILAGRGILNVCCEVADIGCGPGRFAAAFAERAHRVVGLDISEKMIEHGKMLIREKGLSNVELRTCDFGELDISKEGFKQAFDLVFSSMTPAIHDMETLLKSIEMSRKWCCNITHLSRENHLRTQIMREVFGRSLPDRWSGRWFYFLFNALFLMGYYPETSYETRHQEVKVTPDDEYVEFLMEHMLPESEHTPENEKKITEWLKRNADEEGLLLEVSDACYAVTLWGVSKQNEVTS